MVAFLWEAGPEPELKSGFWMSGAVNNNNNGHNKISWTITCTSSGGRDWSPLLVPCVPVYFMWDFCGKPGKRTVLLGPYSAARSLRSKCNGTSD